MNLKVILIFAWCVISVSTAVRIETSRNRPRFRSDYMFMENVNLYLKEHKGARNWVDAVLTCEAEGSKLFVPTSIAQVDAVLNFNNINTRHESTWLGIHDQFTEGKFQTCSGMSVSEVFSNWRLGEPNNGNGKENCVTLMSDGTFSDVTCGLLLPYVCSKEQDKPICENIVYGCDGKIIFRNDYVFVNSIKSYLKYHNAQNWQDAVATCLAEDTTLYIPKSEIEITEVLSRKKIADTYLWIGVHDIFKEGNFVSLEGTTINRLYNKWGPSDPNNWGNIEHCVFIAGDKTLLDAECARKHAFFCIKKVDIAPCSNDFTSIENYSYPKFRSDFVFVESMNLYLKEHQSRSNWVNALLTCSAEGAKLFVPTSKDQVDAVLSFNNIRSRYESTWLGIHDQFTEGQFQTYSGTPITEIYNNWRSGQPNNRDGKENCAMLASDGTFIDVTCNRRLPYVCTREKEMTADQNIVYGSDGKEIFRNDYDFVQNINSYLKRHDAQNWQEAVATCLSEEAILYIPKSEAEITEVISRKKSTDDYLWIGLQDIFQEGNFVSLEGQSIDSIYNIWGPSDPNNWGNNEHCVFIAADKNLLDAECARKHAFFCMKKMNTASSNDNYTIIENDNCPNFPSDYVFVENMNLYVKEFPARSNWITALLTCNGEGAKLFVPTSKAQIDEVLNFNNIRTRYDSTWLGIHDQFSESQFQTFSGTLVSEVYSNWKTGQPDNLGGKENCAMLASDGTYMDVSCERLLPHVCTKEKETVATENIVYGSDGNEIFRNDYEFVQNIHSYLKRHEAQNWQSAVTTCLSEEAMLYIPKSEVEITEVLSRKKSTDDYLWIGVQDIFQEGNFVSLEGQSLNSLYNKWGPVDPNNWQNKEHCVFIAADKTLLDAECARKHAFFCLKESSFPDWSLIDPRFVPAQ